MTGAEYAPIFKILRHEGEPRQSHGRFDKQVRRLAPLPSTAPEAKKAK
jgi:hypothetical protein